MNKIQTNHMRMFINTQTVLDQNTALWNIAPVMVTVKNNLDELIQRIEDQNEKTNPKSKGASANKEKALQTVIEKVIPLSGVLQAYASFTDNLVMAERVKVTKSDITKARETDVEAIVAPVIAAAQEELSNLGDFMVTEEMVTEVQTSLDDFKAQIGQPRTIRNKAYAAMTQLDELFDAANDLLKNKLDKLMVRFQFTNIEFYDTYQRARTIVD